MKNQCYQKFFRWFCAGVAAVACSTHVCASHVSAYGITKKQIYRQTSDSTVALASGSGYGASAFAVPASADSIVVAMLTPPTGVFLPPLEYGDVAHISEATYATQAALDAAYPPGQYTFMIVSSDFMSVEGPASLTLSAGSYPNAPQISNYAAAQSLDPNSSFAVNWNSFDAPGANDFVQLTVEDEFGYLVFQTGFPGQATALAPNARSASIPAFKLDSDSTYTGRVSFHRVGSRNTSDYAGSVGITSYASETRFSLKTTGDSGEDPTDPPDMPPFLMSSNPINGAMNVGLNAPVTFTFSVPMAAAQSITWSPNVVPAKFTSTWSADGRTLTCVYGDRFPASSLINWTLDPATFKDQAGNPLLPFNNTGSFTTGTSDSNPNDPCNGGQPADDGWGAFSLFKSMQYVQTSANAPVLAEENGAMFMAAVVSPKTNPVTQATLRLPNGSTKAIPSMFGQFMFFEEFASQAAMDAAYPPGNYTVTMTRATGTAVLTVQLANNAPPTPQIANYPQTQSFNPTADFTLQWLGFTGATPNDGIHLSMHDNAGNDFDAPDLCVPRPLANTDTSIVVPRNTFASGGSIDGTLQFSKISGIDTNSVPDISGFAGYSKTTEFKFQQPGGTPSSPQIEGLVRQANGTVHFQVKASVGAIVTVEVSTDLTVWTPLTAGPTAAGVLEVNDPQAASHKYRFYRAK